MADTQEKDAVKLYIDTQVVHWYCWLFNFRGVRLDEIHQALVHHREPWIAASRLRSAETRWKALLCEQQLPRDPEMIIVPAPPVPEPHLLQMMGLELDHLGTVVKATQARHLSLPSPPRRVHPHIEKPYRSETSLRTSHFGPDLTFASNPRTGVSSPYNTGPDQQQYHIQGQDFNNNPASQPTSQATLTPLPHHDPPTPPRPAESASNHSMEDAEYELVEEIPCDWCPGRCKCPPVFD